MDHAFGNLTQSWWSYFDLLKLSCLYLPCHQFLNQGMRVDNFMHGMFYSISICPLYAAYIMFILLSLLLSVLYYLQKYCNIIIYLRCTLLDIHVYTLHILCSIFYPFIMLSA